MSGKWINQGVVPRFSEDIPNVFLPKIFQTNTFKVENEETGEIRYVKVHDGQSVGEAIANGQWED